MFTQFYTRLITVSDETRMCVVQDSEDGLDDEGEDEDDDDAGMISHSLTDVHTHSKIHSFLHS